MINRLQLHDQLCKMLQSKSVYFNPPETIKLKYPCFIYRNYPGDIMRANDKIYSYKDKWSITYMTNKSTDDMHLKMLDTFTYCNYDRQFVSNGLYHKEFIIFY